MADIFINNTFAVNAAPNYFKSNTIPVTESVDDSVLLEFRSAQMALLEFNSVNRSYNDVSLEFQTVLEPVIDNDLVCVNFNVENPSISSSEISVPVLSFLHSITIDANNTGTIGNTQIGLYVNDVLINTFDVSANNSSYNYVYKFNTGDVISTGDVIKVAYLDVADDSQGFIVGVYYKVFPNKVEITKVRNSFSSVIMNGYYENTLFKDADYWCIDFNQPIQSIDMVKLYNNDIVLDTPTYILSQGMYPNSRLVITPIDTEITNIVIELTTKANINEFLDIDTSYQEKIIDMPTYITNADLSVGVLLNADSFRYSINGGTYSPWQYVTNYLGTLNLVSSVEGANNLSIEFKKNNITFITTLTYYYYVSEIDCSVYFKETQALITYDDFVPLKNIELYLNDEKLAEEFPYAVSGFDSITLDENNKTILMSTGDVHYMGEKYTYTPILETITEIPSDVFYFFVFDKDTRNFKYVIVETLFGEPKDLPNTNYIPIYKVRVSKKNLVGSVSVRLYEDEQIYENNNISFMFESAGFYKIIVNDIAGRTKEFVHTKINNLDTKLKILTVLDEDLNEVKNGQIHFSDGLTYTVSEV